MTTNTTNDSFRGFIKRSPVIGTAVLLFTLLGALTLIGLAVLDVANAAGDVPYAPDTLDAGYTYSGIMGD